MRPGDHGFLAAVLGSRACAPSPSRVDATTGAAGLIWPGDRVDLILTQTIQRSGDAARPSCRRRNRAVQRAGDRHRPAARAGRRGECERTTQARTVTLEVTQEQAERVSVATRLGRLSLSVRSADSHRLRATQVAAAPNTTWAVDVSPALGAERPPHRRRTRMRGLSRLRRRKGVQVLMQDPAQYCHRAPRLTGCARDRASRRPRPPVAVAAVTAAVSDRPLLLEAGTGRCCRLRAAAANVFVADPKVAEVRPASAASLFVFGVAAGHTTVAALDTAGHTIAQYDVTVQPSAFGAMQAQSMIARLVAGSHVQVQAAGEGPAAQRRGRQCSRCRAGGRDRQRLSSATSRRSRTRSASPRRSRSRCACAIAEMSRKVVRNLGVNWQSARHDRQHRPNPGPDVRHANSNRSDLLVPPADARPGRLCPACNFNGVIDALAQDNLAHILAEPNLTVMSGQSASFLVGGAVPDPGRPAEQRDHRRFQELRRLADVPADRVQRRPHQPARRARGQQAQQSERRAGGRRQFSTLVDPVAHRPPCGDHGGTWQRPELRHRRPAAADAHARQQRPVPVLGDIPVLGALFRDNSFDKQGDRAGDRGDAVHRPAGEQSVATPSADRRLQHAARDRAAAAACARSAMDSRRCRCASPAMPASSCSEAGDAACSPRSILRCTDGQPCCALAACQDMDPYARTDVWQPTGANAGNIAAMVANPHDLIRGRGVRSYRSKQSSSLAIGPCLDRSAEGAARSRWRTAGAARAAVAARARRAVAPAVAAVPVADPAAGSSGAERCRMTVVTRFIADRRAARRPRIGAPRPARAGGVHHRRALRGGAARRADRLRHRGSRHPPRRRARRDRGDAETARRRRCWWSMSAARISR